VAAGYPQAYCTCQLGTRPRWRHQAHRIIEAGPGRSEATGADIEHLGLERGDRTLIVTRKGGKVVTVPLAPRTAQAIDLAIGERAEGPRSWRVTAGGWTGTPPAGSSARPPVARGSPSRSSRTRCGTRSSPPRWMPGSRRGVVQEAASHADPRTTMRYDRARGSLDRRSIYFVAASLASAAR